MLMQPGQTDSPKTYVRFAAVLATIWAYFSAIFLVGEKRFEFEFGIGSWVISILLVVLSGVLFARWAVRRRLVSADTLTNATVLGLTSIISLLLLDVGYSAYLNSSRSSFDYAKARVFDENIWVGELYPKLYYPTERNFAIHKPNVQVAGSPYGNFYSTPMLDSPTLLGSVLARQPVDIRINATGFRESSALGDAQIMALGDSFTFGWGVGESESWPELLERELEMTVYNLGVHDASPKQELELLRYLLEQHGDKIRMKTLLWMIYEGNDLEDDYSEQVVRHDKPVAVPLFKGTVVESAEDLVKTIREQSVIARLRRGQLSWSNPIQKTSGNPFSVDGVDLVYPLYISEKLGPRLFYQYYVDLAGMPASYVETHWNRRALEAVFDEMRKLAESHEFEVAVIFAPTAARLHGPYFTDFPEVSERAHFLELVRHLSVAAGFSFVDLYELMRPYASAELLYFRDDDHFNQRGHALAADVIARQLLRSKQ
jgi:hypothetical protein